MRNASEREVGMSPAVSGGRMQVALCLKSRCFRRMKKKLKYSISSLIALYKSAIELCDEVKLLLDAINKKADCRRPNEW